MSSRNTNIEIDRDGIPQWDGNPMTAEEWEERVWLRFFSSNAENQKLLAPRVKNGLTARTWENSHRIQDIQVRTLMAQAEKEGAEAAMRKLIDTVKASCVQNASLRKNEVFKQFFRRGARRPGEQIADFIARRDT